MKLFLFCALLMLSLNSYSKDNIHGETKNAYGGQLVIWSENSNTWLDVESFWLEYANGNGGLTWGKTTQYPEYSKVKEHDTILIQLEQGTCLMEFFHERWRRANDVRRWNDQLNHYAGCPYVFD